MVRGSLPVLPGTSNGWVIGSNLRGSPSVVIAWCPVFRPENGMLTAGGAHDGKLELEHPS